MVSTLVHLMTTCIIAPNIRRPPAARFAPSTTRQSGRSRCVLKVQRGISRYLLETDFGISVGGRVGSASDPSERSRLRIKTRFPMPNNAGPDRAVRWALYVGWPWQEKYRNASLNEKTRVICERLRRDKGLPWSLLRALNLELEFQKLRTVYEWETGKGSQSNFSRASRLFPFQSKFPSFYLRLHLRLPLPPWTQTPDNAPEDLHGLLPLRHQ